MFYCNYRKNSCLNTQRITYRWLCTQEPGPWGIAAPRRQSTSGEEFIPRSPSIVTAGDTLCSSVLRRRYPTTTRDPNDHAAELPMATACFLPPPSLLSAWWWTMVLSVDFENARAGHRISGAEILYSPGKTPAGPQSVESSPGIALTCLPFVPT